MSDVLAVINQSVIGPTGDALAGVLVAVLSGDIGGNSPVNTQDQPGTPLATIYADPQGNVQLPNPTTTDGLGNLTVYVASGYYVLQVYGAGIAGQQLFPVFVVTSSVQPSSFNKYVTKTISYTIQASDNNTVFGFSGIALTATLPASVPVVPWVVVVFNSAMGQMTLDFNGHHPNLPATLSLFSNQSAIIWSTGSTYTAIINSGWYTSAGSIISATGNGELDLYSTADGGGFTLFDGKGNIIDTSGGGMQFQSSTSKSYRFFGTDTQVTVDGDLTAFAAVVDTLVIRTMPGVNVGGVIQIDGADTNGGISDIQATPADNTTPTILRLSNNDGTNTLGSILFNADGTIYIGNPTSSTGGVVTLGQLIFSTPQSPASNAAGTQGEIAYDANFFYVCISSGVWKRTALTGGY